MEPRGKKILRTRGSGFTKQIVKPVSSFSKQVAQPIIDRREKIKAAGGYIFFQLSQIETESLNILKNAGLPIDGDCRLESLRLGHAHDSRIGYAATQLTICRKIRSLAAEGKFIEACGQAFDLGQTVREEEIKYLTTADGPSRGGKAAARPEVLTIAQRREIRQTMEATLRGQKGTEAKRLARKYRVGERTIQRIASSNFAT